MSLVGFVRDSLDGLHKSLDDAVRDLTVEQLHWRANGKGVHIAFAVWHYARTEDNVIQFALQRKPTVWMDGKWDEKFGLDQRAQGTGMSEEDAAKVRLTSAGDFLTYAQAVWKATDEYLSGLDDAQLEQKVPMGRMGEMPLSRLLGNTLMTHGYTHLGEVYLLRGLMGLKGGPV
jgi:hypothetical protein